MTDDGDRIILGDGLEERPSKIRKREGASERGAKLAIAQKICESIDRYAESPRKAVIPTKVADRSRQLFADKLTITPDERKILKSPREILLIYNSNGTLKKLKMGTDRKVTIPMDTPSDAIISHQHPSGKGPSVQDLKTVLSYPGNTFRIVARNESRKVEIFRLKASEPLPPSEIDIIAKEYEILCNERGNTHQGKRDALALILENHSDILSVLTATTR